MSLQTFQGVIPALMTPFDKQGNYAPYCAKEMIDWMIANGAQGFYLTGSNGYGPAMDVRQRMESVESMIQFIDGRVPTIVHIGAVSGSASALLAKHAMECGCIGISAVPSYYYQLNEDEMEAYYREIAAACDLPLVIYAQAQQFPVTVACLLKLANIPHVQGLKFTGSDHYKMGRIKAALGKDFMVYSGYDEMFLSGLLFGADGLIGGTYNIMPDLTRRAVFSFRQGRVDDARKDLLTANAVLEVLFHYGNIQSAMRECLRFMGVNAGWNPTPFQPLDPQQTIQLKEELCRLKARSSVPSFALFDAV